MRRARVPLLLAAIDWFHVGGLRLSPEPFSCASFGSSTCATTIWYTNASMLPIPNYSNQRSLFWSNPSVPSASCCLSSFNRAAGEVDRGGEDRVVSLSHQVPRKQVRSSVWPLHRLM